jgi:hypothetical protein
LTTSRTALRTTRSLSWNQTIDRTLVHRDAIAEVLLTDLIQLSETEYLVGAQWPRSHRVYRPDGQGRHDPMLLLETVRQAGLAVSHTGFGVGFKERSVMRDVGFELNPDAEPRALTAATNVSIRLTCEQIVRRTGGLRSMTVVLRFAADGVEFAIGTGTIGWLSARTYSALRARAGAPRELPQTVRTSHSSSTLRSAEDALIEPSSTPGPLRQLVIPLDHPVYFDHQLDHAPGMLLIDAAWQAVAAFRGDAARLVECLMECPSFTELGLETNIKLSPMTNDRLTFLVEQGGRPTATGRFRISV